MTDVRAAGPGEPSTSLLAIAVERAGLFKGGRAALIVAQWAVARQSLGHALGHDEGGHVTAAVREYSAWWRETERTGWRDLRRFREVFPEEETPERLAELLGDVRAKRKEAVISAPLLAVA